MSIKITNSVIERYAPEGVTCPFKLRGTLLTTTAVANIDHNLSSTTSQGSLHPCLLEGDGNLIAIYTRDIMDDTVVKTVHNLTKIGKEQFNSFVNEWFIKRSKPVIQLLKTNDLPTFMSTNKETISKDKAKVEVLKEDSALCLWLYIACQIHDGNLEDFFKYENQLQLPSLLQFGQLRGGQKADLVKCLPST